MDPIKDNSTATPVRAIPAQGMYGSDKCMFCGGYYEKIKPFICPYCWEAIKKVVAEYPDEFKPA